VKALRRFTVRATLPPQLTALSDLVLNLRWSWHAETRELLESLDPDLWRTCKGDPVNLLGEISAQRLAGLSRDKRFLRTLSDMADDLQEYLSAPQWYQGCGERPAGIAYFSPEFGITEVLPQYSGGLGILAGDHLKAASDLGVPILAVGLLYRAGYFSQSLSADGWQLEHYPALDPHGLPLALVREEDGTPIRIAVGLAEGRTVHAQIWKAQVGRVPLLLLDSDIEENEAAERSVTDRLYGGGKDHRLVQEMLLGIGGVRAIRAYCRRTSSTSRPRSARRSRQITSAGASLIAAKSDSSPSRCSPSLSVARSRISGATQVGACTPFVIELIGTSPVSKPGQSEPNMLRLTSPCSRLTPLARCPRRSPMCAMLNTPGSSFSAPRARICSTGTPGHALAPPK